MSGSATVTVADILELRADGLTEEEIWSLLCQAVQTLQDLFLSEKLTDGEVVPVVSPNTLNICSKGRVVISLVRQIHSAHKPYLAPEYGIRGGANLNSLDWEKMWVYSLGRTLLSALKASPHLKSLIVLGYMTANDSTLRASLMSLLNIISEYCKTNLPLKPFSHLVSEMYKEVFGISPACLSPLDIADSNGVGMEKALPIESLRDDQDRFNSFESDGKADLRASSVDRMSVSSKSCCPIKRNPVQRAPSRLYRGPFASDHQRNPRNGHRLLPSSCVGPEFVVRGMEPLRVIHVGDVKASNRKSVMVILLTGQKVRMTCDPYSITCGKLFEILVNVEGIEDNFIFGLAFLINGEFVFVPSEMKLSKVAPSFWKDSGNELNCVDFFLYVRVKFFLPSLRGFKDVKTKHLMYLQLRRSLLEQQIKCELQDLLNLGGLAIQAEFGNFDGEEHGTSSYFLLEHYLPEELIEEKSELEMELQEQHRSRYGLDPRLAEDIFVAEVQKLPEYGSHHYTALWVRKSLRIPMWVTVNPQGVYLYEKKKNVLNRKIHEAFVWKNIQGLSYSENYFRLVPQDVFKQKVSCYKLRLDNKKSFFLFRLASFHHQFFLKLRIELSPFHALSQEFGISFEKDIGNVFYVENKANRSDRRKQKEEEEAHLPKNEKKTSFPVENTEERQNKENENPSENKREKRNGVKMGVSAFHSPTSPAQDIPGRGFSFPEAFNESPDVYVLDSSIKSSNGKFTYDLHESISSKLANKWEDVSWEEERILKKVLFRKDKYGSFGLEIVEGNNGGLFVESVLKKRGAKEIDPVQRGDQLLSVNGICLLSLNYREALNVLRNVGSEIEILVSQKCKRETPAEKPLEHEYLKNIRYETANETENLESETPLRSDLS